MARRPTRPSRVASACALLLGTFFGIRLASAQQPANAETRPDGGGDTSAAASSADAGVPADADAGAPLMPDDKLAQQQARIEALEAKVKDHEEELASVRQQSVESSAPSRLLSFWGFSDLSFGGLDYDNPNAFYGVQSLTKPTFFTSGINLYAKSEMTQTLSALIETRLTFTPHGYSNSSAADIKFGDTFVGTVNELQRVDTSTRGPFSYLLYRQNGLLIERAYLEWKPKDWFGIRLGRFLTPFGIWTEDHGSPVLIGVEYPQFMNYNLVPIWQLGGVVFGSIPFGEDVRMEYAATVANSLGTRDEYKDDSSMKGIGARLKIIYNPEPLLIRVGSYSYYSEYRDVAEHTVVQVTADGRPDTAYKPPMGSFPILREASNNVIITADAEVRYKKLRLFGEFVRRTVLFEQPLELTGQEKFLKGIVPSSTVAYAPNRHAYGVYAMVAYEIPVHIGDTDIRVTPYAGYDLIMPSSELSSTITNTQLRAGLNVKPSPFVTVKLEVSRLLPKSPILASEATGVISQVAYSF